MDFENLKAAMSGGTGFLPDLEHMFDKVEILLRVVVMAGPLLLLGFGLLYLLASPKEANHTLGYRFYWGMSSVEVWQFTQRLAGMVWTVLGLVLSIAMAVVGESYLGLPVLLGHVQRGGVAVHPAPCGHGLDGAGSGAEHRHGGGVQRVPGACPGRHDLFRHAGGAVGIGAGGGEHPCHRYHRGGAVRPQGLPPQKKQRMNFSRCVMHRDFFAVGIGAGGGEHPCHRYHRGGAVRPQGLPPQKKQRMNFSRCVMHRDFFVCPLSGGTFGGIVKVHTKDKEGLTHETSQKMEALPPCTHQG